MSEYLYTISQDFPNGKFDTNKLKKEISENQTITIGLLSISSSGDTCTIEFKASLSASEKTELDNVVSQHDGENLPQDEVSNVEIKQYNVVDKNTLHTTLRGFQVDVNLNDDVSFKVQTFDYDVDIVDGFFEYKGFQQDDFVEAIGMPDGDPALGTTVDEITDQDDTLEYSDPYGYIAAGIDNGLFIKIGDSGHDQSLSDEYRIKSIDLQNNQITFDTNFGKTYAASSNLRIYSKRLENCWITTDKKFQIEPKLFEPFSLKSDKQIVFRYHHKNTIMTTPAYNVKTWIIYRF